MEITRNILDEVLDLPFSFLEQLKPQTNVCRAIKSACRTQTEELFSEGCAMPVPFGPFGEIHFPFYKMGNLDSRNLFDIDELILFNFYNKNRHNYKRFADMGANIGLHTIIASRCGFETRSFEPDPITFAQLQKNINANITLEQYNTIQYNTIQYNTAVSSQKGEAKFCRVRGNYMGSHIKGAKENPYGELDYFTVPVEDALEHIRWADLVKMDIEGHEPVVLCATNKEIWQTTDAIVEIENTKNAALVYEHFQNIGVGIFAQKIGWQRVESLEDMPCGYKEGSLFITCKQKMPFNQENLIGKI